MSWDDAGCDEYVPGIWAYCYSGSSGQGTHIDELSSVFTDEDIEDVSSGETANYIGFSVETINELEEFQSDYVLCYEVSGLYNPLVTSTQPASSSPSR